MRILSPRVVVPLALVIVGAGALHLLGARGTPVVPATWPGAPGAPSPPPAPEVVAPAPARSPAGGSAPGGLPVLPGALHQLDQEARHTASGLWELVNELGAAVRAQVERLRRQLEPSG